MKSTAAIILWLSITVACFAGRPPQHERLDWVVPVAKHIVVAKIVSASQPTNGAGDRILQLTIEATDVLIGEPPPSKLIRCRYEEYRPVFPASPHLMPVFRDYTGSGIEFTLKENQVYVFLLATLPTGNADGQLLRVEPLEKKDEIMAIRRGGKLESGEKPQVGPANGSQPIRSETNSTSSAAGSRR